MPKPLVEIDARSLRRFERNLQTLGTIVVPSASREGAAKAGRQAQTLLAVAFRRHIEGGPAPATRVRPGSPDSSVLVDEKPSASRLAKGEVGVKLRVSRKASRWLQFQLGDRKLRRPGVVGVADRANWVPQLKRMRRLGFRMLFPNLAMGTLGTLVAASEAETSDTRGVFYREKGKRWSAGFYKRRGRERAPQLLIAAAKQSRYKGNAALQRAWNTSVERAGGRMSPEIAREIMKGVRRMPNL